MNGRLESRVNTGTDMTTERTENEELKAKLEVAEAALQIAIRTAEWRSYTNNEINSLITNGADDADDAVKALVGQVDELAMLVRRLVYASGSSIPENSLGTAALDYLHRNGLAGDPMRGDADQSSVSSPGDGDENTSS